MDHHQKYNSFKNNLAGLGRVVVAYSGGVDSSFLLKAAVDALGGENVVGCIGISASLAGSQYEQAVKFAEAIGAKLVEVDIDELDDANYLANNADRCFHCKSHLYGKLLEVAREQEIEYVACGSNFDDKDDYRPGNAAAGKLGVLSPLMEARLTKEDIRNLSREMGLETADMPASPCLASRVSYGLEITAERLKQVEVAEEFLRGLGFVEFRVRHHGKIARIEVKGVDMEKMLCGETRGKIVERLKAIGFGYVSVDLEGFRSGSLNESLSEEEKKRNL
ncbi:MAG: ATP-dependent sacrificial sulfur transferase LarE [Phycisphaerae bacterium]|nr:ATP-dependent sacrificial sulfur transferase LarE [Phycisphaerae bacterium]